MKVFKIVSTHDVYEDSYNEGEGKHANYYTNSAEIKKETVEEAIKEYINNHLCYEYSERLIHKEDNVLHLTVIVDNDNLQPSKDEIKQWEEGKIKLYANNIAIEVYEVVRVSI